MFVIDVQNKTKGTLPRVPFALIAKKILGSKYELSLVFVTNSESKRLNRIHREKNKPTNILSFPLSSDNGEIFIDLELCKKQCAEFNRTYTNFVGFLVIHGLLHLKGYDHGSTMEREEARYRKMFGI